MDNSSAGLSVAGADHPVFAYEARLVAAQLAGDVQNLDLLLDDALFYTGLTGELGYKKNDLELHRSGHFRITRMQPLQRQSADLGDTVVVNVLMDTAAEIRGVSMNKLLRYTRVWTRRGEHWRLVAAHLSEAAAGKH